MTCAILKYVAFMSIYYAPFQDNYFINALILSYLCSTVLERLIAL